MQIRKTITVVAASLAVSGAAFGTVAAASSSDAPKADTSTAVLVADTGTTEPTESTAADTDNVQEGDRTAPDANAAESESAPESESGPSDGPGGHEDPPGNVDHQFEGEE